MRWPLYPANPFGYGLIEVSFVAGKLFCLSTTVQYVPQVQLIILYKKPVLR